MRRLEDRFTLPPFRALLTLLSALPLEAAAALGDSLGRLGFAFVSELRRRTLRHLSVAFGDRRDDAFRLRTGLASFRLLGACAFEWLVLCRMGPRAAAERVVEVEGFEHVERALAAGDGVLVATPHFGLFELMPVWFLSRGAKGKVVGRRHSAEGLESLLTRQRLRMGVETIPQQHARDVLRVLRRGEIVGVLPDQDVDKLAGIFLPFFGAPAYTTTGPATLSVLTGAPILPAFLYRLAPGRYRLVVHPPVPDPGGAKEERVRAMTEGFTLVFEEEIAARPDHWAWIHERWSTTPESLARRRKRRARAAALRTRAARS